MMRPAFLLAAASFMTAAATTTWAQDASGRKRVVIEYTDLTGTQPMSSAPWVSHVKGFHLYEVGKPASVHVEELSEFGNPEYILGEALTDHETFGDFAVGLPDVPGSTRKVELTVDAAAKPFSSASHTRYRAARGAEASTARFVSSIGSPGIGSVVSPG